MSREFDLRRHRYSLQGSSVQMKDLLEALDTTGRELFKDMSERHAPVRVAKLNHFTELLEAVNDEHALLLEHAAAVQEHDRLVAEREAAEGERRAAEREAANYKHKPFEPSADDAVTIKELSRDGFNTGRERFLETARNFTTEVQDDA